MPEPIELPSFFALMVCIKYRNPGAAADMQMFNSLLERVKHPIKQLEILDNGSVSDALVMEKLEYFSQVMKPGDRLYFYVTSHGDQVKAVDDKDEKDGKDEYLVLDNGYILLDDHIFTRLCQFRSGTEIVFIVDACSSGSTYKILKPGIKKMHFIQKSAYQFKADSYSTLKAEIIYMGAAFDGGLAQPGNDGSVFTKQLYKATIASPTSSYRQLFARIYKNIAAHQTPVYTEVSAKGINESHKKDSDKISVSFRDQPAFPGEFDI